MTLDISLQGRIRRLYDSTTQGWVSVWGEHLHHGDYGPEGDAKKNHRQAQVDMVDTLLDWGGMPASGTIQRVLDAGCGVGGSARHLASRLHAEVEGVTLSPVQRTLAEELSKSDSRVRFQVADATQTSFEDGSFDLVWALESAEHMPSKADFLREGVRLLRPGGRLILATWCHRPVPPRLGASERKRLDRISWSYGRSLTWVPRRDYESLMSALSFEDVRTEDWSHRVAPFWSAVLRSVLTQEGLQALVKGGRSMWVGAYGGIEMRRSLRDRLVRYVVVTGVKGGFEV